MDELFLPGAPSVRCRDINYFSWRNFFLWSGPVPESLGTFRAQVHPAVCQSRNARAWMIEHLEGSDGLGAIYPSMQYPIMALDVLGYNAGPSTAGEAEKRVQQLDGG